MAAQSDSEEEIDPVKMLLVEEDEQEKTLLSPELNAAKPPQMQQHYIRSIDSTVVTRQLPSEGLSFQLWPAATTLLTLLDYHRGNTSNSPLSTTLPAEKTPRRLKILELASGIGLVGIAAAVTLGSYVTVTDIPHVIPNLKFNVDANADVAAKHGGTIPPRRLKILELGSGTGLVGIAAAVTLGSDVTVTDLPHVIPNLKFNVDANADVVAKHGGSVVAAPLRWGEEEDVATIGKEFDLILASDVVYHDHLYDPLIKTLRLLLCGGEEEKEVVFVMAHLRRWKKDAAFFKKARKLFDVKVLHVDQPKDGSRTGVVVYRFVSKMSKSGC